MTDTPSSAAPRSRLFLIFGAVLAALLVLLAGIVLGRLTAPGQLPTPGNTSAEAGFARDMQTHHNQAVQMSLLIYEETTDEDIRTLSYDIAASQSQQAGQMYGWLSTWELPPAAPEPSMTWMTRPALDGVDHEHGGDMEHTPGEPMPGLATAEQIDELEAATGAEADRIFLELMIAHHQGGVEMAQAVLDRSEEPVVVSLATGVLTVQEGEIAYMRELLARD